jgi:N-formylglutamate deformylase
VLQKALMGDLFQIRPTVASEVPILLSVPHCGTVFPDELKEEFQPEHVSFPDDTDWFVDKLYDFAPSMGIAIISARVSRYVIDLNRNPEEKPLYTDGRLITGLCPTTTFLGQPLYNDARTQVDPAEVRRRLTKYFIPYHEKIQSLLDGLRQRHGQVLLWDCHSIRQSVPTIHKEPFPDLILGDADGTSASPGVIEAALSVLDHSPYRTLHNSPFKGGYITRHFGKPALQQHALQLEMTKVNYMDESERAYDEAKAAHVREVLREVFLKFIEQL